MVLVFTALFLISSSAVNAFSHLPTEDISKLLNEIGKNAINYIPRVRHQSEVDNCQYVFINNQQDLVDGVRYILEKGKLSYERIKVYHDYYYRENMHYDKYPRYRHLYVESLNQDTSLLTQSKITCTISVTYNDTSNIYSNKIGRVDRGLHVHISPTAYKCDTKSIFNETSLMKTSLLLITANYVKIDTVLPA